jgi:hypothetical protein
MKSDKKNSLGGGDLLRGGGLQYNIFGNICKFSNSLSDFISRCTKIVKYYAPSWKVNPSYWAKFHFQMHCDSEIPQNCSPLRNATPLIGPDFISRCTEIVKYYKIVSLKKGHTSYKVYFIIVEGWPYEGGTTVYSLNFIIMYSDKLLTWRTHQFIVIFSW